MTLDLQPTLSGPTLLLRPLHENDRGALAAAASDPLIWAQHPAWDRWQPAVFDRLFDENVASRGTLLITTHAGDVIGSSRYARLDEPDGGSVEIGWTFLTRAYWGGPTNTELKRLMVDHAFTAVETVTFRVGAENRRSRRAVEKLGATLAGEVEIPLGPHVIYALRRP
jgi:N-acetyltransferase